MDQLINSLQRGEESVTTFTVLEVDPGESLANTAAQSGIIDLRPFRKAADPLLHKFGLKPCVKLKKIEAAISLRVLPTGHVAHNLTDFAPGGWKVPTREQTKLFQARTGDFRNDDSTRSQISQVVSHIFPTHSHLSLCRNICACDCRTDDQTTTDYPSGDVLTQEASTSECSFASGFDVEANSSMGKSSAVSRGSVAKTCPAVPCPRERAAWQAVMELLQETSSGGHQWTYATGNAADVA